jgi:hypothetical protein
MKAWTSHRRVTVVQEAMNASLAMKLNPADNRFRLNSECHVQPHGGPCFKFWGAENTGGLTGGHCRNVSSTRLNRAVRLRSAIEMC